MQPLEFSLGIKDSEMIESRTRKSGSHQRPFRRPETIPGKLLSSRARFRFVSGINRKPALGLSLKRKPIGGLTIQKCQLFSGRVSYLFVPPTLRDTAGHAGRPGTQ